MNHIRISIIGIERNLNLTFGKFANYNQSFFASMQSMVFNSSIIVSVPEDFLLKKGLRD